MLLASLLGLYHVPVEKENSQGRWANRARDDTMQRQGTDVTLHHVFFIEAFIIAVLPLKTEGQSD